MVPWKIPWRHCLTSPSPSNCDSERASSLMALPSSISYQVFCRSLPGKSYRMKKTPLLSKTASTA
jgi:hypothetical protein